MLFNSTEFMPFLGLVLLVYWWLIPRSAWRGRKLALLLASYGFYMSWSPVFGALLLYSTLVDYSVGLVLDRSRNVRNAATPDRRDRLAYPKALPVIISHLKDDDVRQWTPLRNRSE